MPRKKQAQTVTLVGAKLPVSECLLLDDSGDSYVVQVVEKNGRGRGVKTFRNTYTIPRSAVSYYFTSEEIDVEEAADAPVAAPAKKKAAPKKAAEKPAAAPKKRGRPKGSKNAKTKAAAEKPADAPKKRGRPKGSKKADKKDASDKSSKKKTIDALFGDNF
jgi:hypothetical protein